MNRHSNELQELKGIGVVLSRRLIESSYDTIVKVAGAELKGINSVKGMTPQKARDIVSQARKMVGETEKNRHTWRT